MAIFLLLLLLLVSAVSGDEDAYIGVNIGTDLSDMPTPTEVVALLKAQRIRHVRLYDADQAMLLALAKTGIQVTVSVPNDQLLGIGQSNATAANWVARNIVAHVPATNITAASSSNLDDQIKVSTPHSSSIILDSFPPSQAFFNRSWDPFMVPLLKFLQSTGSYLMLNVYPYYDYMQSNGKIPLDYALFRPLPPNKEAVDANTLLHYTNVFDAGDSSEPDAIVDNANTYNSNLIKHVLNNTGTPKHPGIAVSTYIYELYNEDLRPGSDSEKTGGYLMPMEYQKVDCSPLLLGHPCYEPDNVASHSTYAFNAYYQRMAKSPGTCDFKGVATITTSDPSHGSCIFPGSSRKNGDLINGTSLAPSSNDTSSARPLFSCRTYLYSPFGLSNIWENPILSAGDTCSISDFVSPT
ncbi:hypothetical protein CXB51_005125 [Gossypium anomalum]|uniref:glucan endo-1,3-beta-D-glucosidase n=1 Tax=Gossypium anomalum TaxID=47600 RepID=A0A8J5ZBK6_9ROSI|nr:hypothetical protein CXB51_005125 [Gossypium anomalum]